MPELFSIETEALRLVWSQRRMKPVAVTPAAAEQPFGLAAEALGRGEVPAVHIREGNPRHLFEETDYTLFAQSKTGAPLRVRHRDPVLIRGLQHADAERLVHGVINFGAQVGQSRFVVEVEGTPGVAFVVEVYPSKLDYRDDYEALRDDVQEIAADLACEYLRATRVPGAEDAFGPPGVVAWVVLLGHVIGDLEQALGYITRQPQWGTQRVVEVHRADGIRRPDAALRRAVLQGRGRGPWQHTDAALPVRERLPAARGRYTLDTPEHRWLAAQLALVQTRLAALRADEARRPPSTRRRQVQHDLDALQHRLARLARQSVLREAEGEPPEMPPWRLLAAPGYRQAYRACLRLLRGLRLEGGPLRLALKELHLLYEYWCFLTLVRLAAEATGCRAPLRSLIAVERRGLQVRLQKGRAQTVTFPLSEGRQVDLIYNPRFGGPGYLVPQQPDMMLTLRHPDGGLARYVLDAKYRLDASPGYRRRYGVPGPPPEALNTLHRYRDAIQDRCRADGRAVVQAVALFPYREEAPGLFAQSRHRRMLDEIGVGALPLLPGHTAHLAAWLQRVIQAT